MRLSLLLSLLVLTSPGCGAPPAAQQHSAVVVPTKTTARPSLTAQAIATAEPPVVAQAPGAEPAEIETDELDQTERGPRYAWYQTYATGGPWYVITELSIPDVFTDKRSEMSIRRCQRVDADGIRSLGPRRSSMEFGCGAKDGSGYGGGINLGDTDSEDTIFLEVDYYWTTKEQVRGSIKGGARVQIGVPAEVDLYHGCHLNVTWRRNESMPDEPLESFE